MLLLLLRLYGKERELPLTCTDLSKTPEQERAGRSSLTNTVSMLKACSFLCSPSLKSRGLNRVPKGSVEGVLQGLWGLWCKRKSESFVNAYFSSILHIDISCCLANAKKKKGISVITEISLGVTLHSSG